MKVLVCGSRTWTNKVAIKGRLAQLPKHAVILCGGARGADELADQCARELDLEVDVHPADWGRYGQRAGLIRNDKMLALGPALVLAFWDGQSTGTKYTIDKAREKGYPVEVFEAVA